MNTLINQIIFQDINDEFAYGQFLDFNVIIMKSNGFINATKLCNEGGKRFREWKSLKSTQEYINYLEDPVRGYSSTPVLEVINV